MRLLGNKPVRSFVLVDATLSRVNTKYQSNLLPVYLLSVASVCYASISRADVLDAPFYSANRHPFIQLYGLPSAQHAQPVVSQNMHLGFLLEAASNFILSENANEILVVDGESHRMNLQLRYGLTSKIEFGLDIPYISHEGGGLDSAINEWHNFFGFMDGGRSDFDNNQLNYAYSDSENTPVNLTQPANGFGDASISFAYQLVDNTARQWAVRTGVKLPTGDATKWHGSQSTDVFLGLHVSDQALLKNHNIHLHASVGTLWMDSPERMSLVRKDWVIYGSSTLSWTYNENLRLKAQIDFHSAFYNSSLAELGSDSAQLVLGGALRWSDDVVINLSISEDIVVDTAPDIVFRLGLTWLRY